MERDLATRLRPARTRDLSPRSAAVEDWKAVLESAGEEHERLERELAAVDAELKALRTEAADEVGAARTALEGLTETRGQQRAALDDAERALTEARTELARLEGETPLLRERATGLDLDALRTARDAAREALEVLPPLEEGTDPAAMREEAETADRSVRELETELRRAEGALEQTGGQYLDEHVSHRHASQQGEENVFPEFGDIGKPVRRLRAAVLMRSGPRRRLPGVPCGGIQMAKGNGRVRIAVEFVWDHVGRVQSPEDGVAWRHEPAANEDSVFCGTNAGWSSVWRVSKQKSAKRAEGLCDG